MLHAPCVGRCETAPVAVVGQNPVPHATAENVAALVQAKREAPAAGRRHVHPHLDIVTPGHIDYAAYREAGRLRAGCDRASAARDGATTSSR